METTQLYTSIAPLRNVSNLVSLIDRTLNRDVNLPGMATFYGPSGFGKTTAATYAANRFNALFVQVKSTWTQRSFCEAILRDIGERPRRTVAALVDQISGHMAQTGRPLLIDEADFLVQRKMVELLRDIYESSGSPVILIGEENLPQNLRKWERVHGRMLGWVAAEPGTKDDLDLLAKIYAPDVEIGDELKSKIFAASNRSIRRMSVNLASVKERAAVLGTSKIGAAEWGSTGFYTGEAPPPRPNLRGISS